MGERGAAIAGCAGAALVAWNSVAIARAPAVGQLVLFYAPMAAGAWLAAAVAMLASVRFLRRRNFPDDSLSVAAIEVGLMLLAGSLGAGTVWERAISGRWWDWNAPLTAALACGLLYVGYLILRHAVDEPTERAKFSAVFSVFVFLDIPVAALAVVWWCRKHPQPVMWSGLRWSPDLQLPLASNFLGLLLLAGALMAVRVRQEEAQRELDALRRRAHAF